MTVEPVSREEWLATLDYAVELGNKSSVDHRSAPDYKVVRIYDREAIEKLTEVFLGNSGNDIVWCKKIGTAKGGEWYLTHRIDGVNIKTIAFSADRTILEKIKADREAALDAKLSEGIKDIIKYLLV